MFRKTFHAFGGTLIGLGFYFAINWIVAWWSGEVTLQTAVALALINVGFVSGIGALFLCFDPHKVIRHHYMNYHLLTSQNRRSSFGEKIGLGDDDDSSE